VIRARTALFLDSALKTPIPLPLPDLAAMKVHRVLVAHGACARCRAALGGSGTLMIKPDIVGPAHITPQARGGSPFAVGQVNPAKGYIHVLDDAALVLLLRTLDTAADLIAYLSKKEILVTSGRLGFAAGEEALLGWYLATFHSYKYAGCTPCNSSLLEFVTLSRLRARAVFARFEPARIAIANMSQPTAASGALRRDRVRHECDKNGQEELNALRCRNRRNASPEGCCAPILTEVHSGTRLR